MQCLMNLLYIRGGTMLLFRGRIGYIGSLKRHLSGKCVDSIEQEKMGGEELLARVWLGE